MNWRTIITLCIIQITYFTMTSFAATANPDIGKFKEAPCPFPLPEGFVLGENFIFGYVTFPELHENLTAKPCNWQ